MNIQISFQKTKFNKATEDFLCSKMDEDSDAELITNLREIASGDKKYMCIGLCGSLPHNES